MLWQTSLARMVAKYETTGREKYDSDLNIALPPRSVR
jgi:hypothetical protein